MMRRYRHASTAGQQHGQIEDAVSIRERPPEAEDRAAPGHTGKGNCSPDQ